MINNVVLMGRLTRDPETRYAGDSKVANFTLAVDRSVNRQTGERITDFIRCAAWGRTADFVQQWFSKGMMAIVTGQIETHTWTDKDGKTRLDTTVHARTVQFGESKKSARRNWSADRCSAGRRVADGRSADRTAGLCRDAGRR